MTYSLRIKRSAKRKLQGLPTNERFRIVDAISRLGRNPEAVELNTKQLSGSSFWRLRVGRWRVIYDRKDDVRIISIEKIGPRGDIYK